MNVWGYLACVFMVGAWYFAIKAMVAAVRESNEKREEDVDGKL